LFFFGFGTGVVFKGLPPERGPCGVSDLYGATYGFFGAGRGASAFLNGATYGLGAAAIIEDFGFGVVGFCPAFIEGPELLVIMLATARALFTTAFAGPNASNFGSLFFALFFAAMI